MLALMLAAGGCSLSYQLNNLHEDSADQTGSLRAATVPKASTEMLVDGDLPIAQATVNEVLTKGGKHTSLPWENQRTGARGTVTPLASTYQQNGITCRDFLASYVRKGSELWLEGEACRDGRGKWKVRGLRARTNT